MITDNEKVVFTCLQISLNTDHFLVVNLCAVFLLLLFLIDSKWFTNEIISSGQTSPNHLNQSAAAISMLRISALENIHLFSRVEYQCWVVLNYSKNAYGLGIMGTDVHDVMLDVLDVRFNTALKKHLRNKIVTVG